MGEGEKESSKDRCTLIEAYAELKLHWGGVCLSLSMALGQTCQNIYVNDANDVNDFSTVDICAKEH